MNHSSQRPTAKDIVDIVGEAMTKGIEDLGGSYLVPSYYEVLLHPDALDSLKSVLPYVQERSRARLEKQLASLNHRHYSRELGGLKKWFNRTFSRQDITTSPPTSQVYKRVNPNWIIEINPCFDADIPLNYISVRAELGEIQVPEEKQKRRSPLPMMQNVLDPTPRTRRFTATEPVAPKPVASTPVMHPVQHNVFAPSEPKVHRAVASLTYQDNTGRQVFQMTTSELTIGRADTANADIGLRIHTTADVSRLHLRIRYSEQTKSFLIRDESKFGTHLDGLPLPSNTWTSLNVYAEILLADTILITFQAL